MLSSRVTACIFAYNEEHRLQACVEDLSGAFPILVVDNYSTDRTLEVADRLGVRHVQIRNPGFIETSQVMDPLSQIVTTPFILIISVSELVPFPLLKAYADVAEEDKADIVRVRRISITAGEPIPLSGKPGMRHPGELRFFRKGSVDFSATVVHSWGSPRVGARVLRLSDELFFYQYRDYDCSRTEQVICRYNDLQARQLYAKGRRFSYVKSIAHALFVFFRAYLRMNCRRFGAKGFLECVYVAWGVYSTWLRLLEIEQDLSLERVRERNAAVRRAHADEVRGCLREAGGSTV